jgi:hypothetical protein
MRIIPALDESAYFHRVAQYGCSLLGHRLILGLDSKVAHASGGLPLVDLLSEAG